MTIMEYCNTYGILKYCSIKDHLRMQQRELCPVLGLEMWRAVSYLCILQSWSGLSTAAARWRCVAGENQFGTVENLSAVYFQFSSKLLSLSRHLAPIPFADNYIFLTWNYSKHIYLIILSSNKVWFTILMFSKIVIFRETGSCFQRINDLNNLFFPSNI